MILYDISKTYFWQRLFVMPLLIGIVLIIMLIINLVLIVRLVQKRKNTKNYATRQVGHIISIILICCFLFNYALYFRFGIHMPSDEGEAITYIGRVQEIRKIPRIIRFGYGTDGSHRNAFSVIINDSVFFCLEADSLKVGDMVIIKYLSHSHVIIYCELM